MNGSQTRSELGVFQTFSEVCPLDIIRESISKRNPPEPDVFCKLGDGEEVAFELVEIIDEDWARLTSGQFREAKSLREGYLRSTAEYRRALDERIANALVYVSFVADVPARRRRSAVPDILRHLSTIRPDFCGEWKPPSGTTLHGRVRGITVSRGDWDGPEFDVEAVGAIGDPTLERVRAKWRNCVRFGTSISSFSRPTNFNPRRRRPCGSPASTRSSGAIGTQVRFGRCGCLISVREVFRIRSPFRNRRAG